MTMTSAISLKSFPPSIPTNQPLLIYLLLTDIFPRSYKERGRGTEVKASRLALAADECSNSGYEQGWWVPSRSPAQRHRAMVTWWPCEWKAHRSHWQLAVDPRLPAKSD